MIVNTSAYLCAQNKSNGFPFSPGIASSDFFFRTAFHCMPVFAFCVWGTKKGQNGLRQWIRSRQYGQRVSLSVRTHVLPTTVFVIFGYNPVLVISTVFFFLSFNLLIGWQLSIWNCCKPFFSLLYNCQLLCFWRLALSIVVEVFPGTFSRILLLQGCLPQFGIRHSH